MPLVFPGEQTQRETRVQYRSLDVVTGQNVVVYISAEVITDYGENRALKMASQKYDDGDVDYGAVYVVSDDFKDSEQTT